MAECVLKKRGFEIETLVGKVTQKEFTKKLNEIKKLDDIGLFMLVVSSHGDERQTISMLRHAIYVAKTSSRRYQ